MTEVVVIRAVAGEKRHAISLENIIGIGNLCQSKLLVEKARQSSKETVLVRLLITQFGSVFVGLTGQLCACLRVLQNTSTWSRQGKNSGGDAKFLVDFSVRLGSPLRELPSRRSPPDLMTAANYC